MGVRYVELRRHTDNDGDELTGQGVADAEAIGREGLQPPYAAFVSSGAARAMAASASRRVSVGVLSRCRELEKSMTCFATISAAQQVSAYGDTPIF